MRLDKFIGFKADEHLVARLREVAEAEDRSVSAVVRRALAAGLNPVTDVRIGEGDASRFEPARG